MTDPTPDIPRVPDRAERVRQTLLRFEHSSARPCSMMSLGDDELFEVGMLLSDRELSIADAWREVNTLLGGDRDVPRSTFYNFADRFKSLLAQVTAEHARRRWGMSLANTNDDNIRNVSRYSRQRLLELLADKLATTDDLAEIDRYMAKMAAILADTERAQHAEDRLELDQLNYERLVRETDAKLEVAEQRIEQMQLDAARKRDRIEERLSQLQASIDTLKKRAARGETITEEHLRHADADLEAVRKEAA
ncbi:MAG: hypothetical protein AAGA29_07815 [Planctomycetota bacterium]